MFCTNKIIFISEILCLIFIEFKKIFGPWTNVGNCNADLPGVSCGPGKQGQERKCTNGTKDKCTDEDRIRTVSCAAAKTQLPNCQCKLF